MGGQYKKFLRSEKAKVKLKGVKLPKGLNVTKTDFKVKKITIREQLADIGTESKKEYNVKEILSRLKHHNSSFQMAAYKSLKDLINSNPVAVFRHLGQIVQGISANCLDIDTDVRRESFKVMSLLFSITEANGIRPFFDVIASYFRCAMTHIQPNIQEDALLFLDVLMKYIPNLVAESGEGIFQNFLDMISKLKQDQKQGRALTTNPNRMKTTKWRIKVLQRLHGMLQTVLKYKMSTEILTTQNSRQGISYFNSNKEKYFPLANVYSKVPISVDIFKTKLYGIDLNKTDDGDQIRHYVNVLLPLLYESWIEVRPFSNRDNKIESHLPLSMEGTCTLKIVLDIFDCIWELIYLWERIINNDDLSNSYKAEHGETFVTHFCCAFPYEHNKESKEVRKEFKGIKSMRTSDDPNCLEQNLMLCYLYCTFFSKNISRHCRIAGRILDFLSATLKSVDYGRYGSYIQKALKAVLYENGMEFMEIDGDKTRNLLKKILSLQKIKKSRESCETGLLILLSDIVLDDHLYEIYGINEFHDWLASLPELLQQQNISRRSLHTLCNLAKRKNKIFLDSLKLSHQNITNNLSAVKFNGFDNQEEGTKTVLDLLYWIDIDTQEG